MVTTRTLSQVGTEVLNVKDPRFGAVGDGSADDTVAIQAAVNLALGTAISPHATSSWLNRPIYFPSGRYRVTGASGLRLPRSRGVRMFGDGRFAAQITNSTTNGTVFTANGLEYSEVSGLYLVSNGTGSCFDLNWDGTGPGALQGNSFRDLYTEAGAYGWKIGAGGFMGSENLWLNCHATGHTTAGYATLNWNALQNTLIGGNVQSCGVGVLQTQGSFTSIHSVGFQLSGTYDMKIDNSAYDTTVVTGCRSESTNMMLVANGRNVIMDGCSHITSSATDGWMLNQNTGMATVRGCYSVQGALSITDGRLRAENCEFGRSDWITRSGTSVVEIATIHKGWNVAASAYVDRQRINASGTTLTYTPT